MPIMGNVSVALEQAINKILIICRLFDPLSFVCTFNWKSNKNDDFSTLHLLIYPCSLIHTCFVHSKQLYSILCVHLFVKLVEGSKLNSNILHFASFLYVYISFPLKSFHLLWSHSHRSDICSTWARAHKI